MATPSDARLRAMALQVLRATLEPPPGPDDFAPWEDGPPTGADLLESALWLDEASHARFLGFVAEGFDLATLACEQGGKP